MRKELLGLGLLALIGSAQAANLKAGTEVKVILLRELTSGGSVLNEAVPMAVAEDVLDENGRVLISEGTLALGKVSQVRREGALSAAVFDKPARLAVTLQHTWSADDQKVPLLANMNKKPKELIQFNRDNTQIKDPEAEAIADAWKVSRKYTVLSRLVDVFKGGGRPEDFQDRTERVVLTELAQSISLRTTLELILDDRLGQFIDVLDRIRKGHTIEALTGIGRMVTNYQTYLRAAGELARLGSNVANYIEGRFSGRNIRAPGGLTFSVYVAKDMDVKPAFH